MRILFHLDDKTKRLRRAVSQFVAGVAGQNKPVITGLDGVIHPSLTGAVPLPGQFGYTRQYRVYADMNNPETRNRGSAGWAVVYLTNDGTINGSALFYRPHFEMTAHGQYGAQLASNPADRELAELHAPRPLIGWMSFDRKAVFVAVTSGGTSEQIQRLRGTAQAVAPDVLRGWTGTLRVFESRVAPEDLALVSEWDFTKTGGQIVGASIYNAWKHYLPDAYTDTLGIPRSWRQPSQVYVSNGYPAHVPSNNVLVSNNYAPTGATGITKAGDLTTAIAIADDNTALRAAILMDNGYDRLFSGSVYRLDATGVTVTQPTTVTFNRAARQTIPDGGNAATAKFAAQIYYRSTGGNITLETDAGAVLATLPATATYQRVAVETIAVANQTTTTIRLNIPVGRDVYFIGQQFETHGDADFALATSLIPTAESNTTGQLRLPRDIGVNHSAKSFRPFELSNVDGSYFTEATLYSAVRFRGYPSQRVLLAWFGHNGELTGGAEETLSVKVFALSAGGKSIEIVRQGQPLQTFNIASATAIGDVVKVAIGAAPGELRVAVNGTAFASANPYIAYTKEQFEIAHNETGANWHGDLLTYRLYDKAKTTAQLTALTL